MAKNVRSIDNVNKGVEVG